MIFAFFLRGSQHSLIQFRARNLLDVSSPVESNHICDTGQYSRIGSGRQDVRIVKFVGSLDSRDFLPFDPRQHEKGEADR